MAKKKRRGVTLFELLQKDRNTVAGPVACQPGGAAQHPAGSTLQEPAATRDTLGVTPVPEVSATAEQSPQNGHETPARLQVDEDGYILHLSRNQTILVAVGAVVVLVVVLLIGNRMFGSDKDLRAKQVAQGQEVDGEKIEALASLVPPPGSDGAVPDSPVRVPRANQPEKPGNDEAAEPDQDGQARPMTAARIAAAPEAGAEPAAGLASGDTRQAGLNYLIIQIIPTEARPSPQAHATEIRKFLASKGIRTLMVSTSTGGTMVVSEQGYDDRRKFDSLIEKVRQAGKEYASAKYMGRYNFASPYAALFSGK